MEDRDRFVLSKGHTAPALYGVLAEKGFIPKEDIKTFGNVNSYLQGHPDMNKVPGVDMSPSICKPLLSTKIVKLSSL